MAKRSSSAGGNGVSLFPFLSILACLIGLLTLMIKILSDLQSVERGQNQEEIAVALDHQRLQRQIKQQQEQQAAIRKKLEQKGATVVALQDLEDRRTVLRKELEADRKEDAENSDATLQRRIENLIAQIAALIKERPPLDAKIAELTKELEDRKLDPNAEPPPVIVQPRGLGERGSSNLYFIECNADSVVIRQQDGERTSVSSATITTDPALNQFFNEVKSDRRAMILFLIRTDGNGTYQRAAGWAEHQFGLQTGKLPIPNKGAIDLSRFTR